eukprot:TRINITY_DN56495_c0_g1_i2.p1 TRINITY_DN56495_c0_g1~~TRINITY_DN56495_c0_g1_i2.p1  ORF type:complete len:263 (-),score=46.28 TRINITY_DN56495_c0_g1_i2:31-720(-)
MVIPLPAGSMGTPMMGPPPAEVAGRFQVIKYCVMGMIAGLLGQLVWGALVGKLSNAIWSSLNLLLNTVIGIFLLRDDPQIGRIYKFLVTTICQACGDQCGGGMSCLMTFVLCNAITVVMNLLLDNVLGALIAASQTLFTVGLGPYDATVVMLLFVSLLVSLVSQILGAWNGWKAYTTVRDSGVTASGGGEWGGSGGYPTAAERGQAREARPAPGFQPFSGGGNRLGGGS